uniref:Receptor expression-enhancing protein n=1 Tax=Plectus sambesii TaxID=2011161 RepID=A0A914WRV6_9BILA
MADNYDNEEMLKEGKEEQHGDVKIDKGNEESDLLMLVERIEQRDSTSNEHLVLAFSALFGAYIAFSSDAKLVCNLITIGYPAYESIKALITKREPDDVQWLIYWAVVAFLAPFDLLSEILPTAFPYYWLLKYVFLLFLCLPQTKSALAIYNVIFGTKLSIDKCSKGKDDRNSQELEAIDSEWSTTADRSTNATTMSMGDATKSNESVGVPVPTPRNRQTAK